VGGRSGEESVVEVQLGSRREKKLENFGRCRIERGLEPTISFSRQTFSCWP